MDNVMTWPLGAHAASGAAGVLVLVLVLMIIEKVRKP